ncbi:hypothetical protein [Massilia phosphatilytica]
MLRSASIFSSCPARKPDSPRIRFGVLVLNLGQNCSTSQLNRERVFCSFPFSGFLVVIIFGHRTAPFPALFS